MKRLLVHQIELLLHHRTHSPRSSHCKSPGSPFSTPHSVVYSSSSSTTAMSIKAPLLQLRETFNACKSHYQHPQGGGGGGIRGEQDRQLEYRTMAALTSW